MVGLVSCTKLLLYNNAHNSAGHVSNPCVCVCVCTRVPVVTKPTDVVYTDADAIAAALHVPTTLTRCVQHAVIFPFKHEVASNSVSEPLWRSVARRLVRDRFGYVSATALVVGVGVLVLSNSRHGDGIFRPMSTGRHWTSG